LRKKNEVVDFFAAPGRVYSYNCVAVGVGSGCFFVCHFRFFFIRWSSDRNQCFVVHVDCVVVIIRRNWSMWKLRLGRRKLT